MDFKTLVTIILISSYLTLVSGCGKRVLIKEPEKYWWTEGATWIKAGDYDKWIKVIKVEADSVYGSILDRSGRRRSKTLVTIHLSSVELIKKEEDNPVGMLISGMTVGALVTLVALTIHISHSFADAF